MQFTKASVGSVTSGIIFLGPLLTGYIMVANFVGLFMEFLQERRVFFEQVLHENLRGE